MHTRPLHVAAACLLPLSLGLRRGQEAPRDPHAAQELQLLASTAEQVEEGARQGGAEFRTSEVEPPKEKERKEDLYQCDRQCRWEYGFLDRDIIGRRVEGSKCKCYKRIADDQYAELNDGETLDRFNRNEFDVENTWSGDFSCDLVCAKRGASLVSLTREEAAADAGVKVLHCGRCSVCSAEEDAVVLSLTRKWITNSMANIAGRFAAPWGHGDVGRLEKELSEAGMNFSTARADGRTDQPTCMQCWTDNIMCTRNSCIDKCWIKLFDSSNPKVDITNCGTFDFNCQCLKCDEEYCGPAFIKCAGANRRSTGIVSDIGRPAEQQCQVGLYSGVADADLPTAPMPDLPTDWYIVGIFSAAGVLLTSLIGLCVVSCYRRRAAAAAVQT